MADTVVAWQPRAPLPASRSAPLPLVPVLTEDATTIAWLRHCVGTFVQLVPVAPSLRGSDFGASAAALVVFSHGDTTVAAALEIAKGRPIVAITHGDPVPTDACIFFALDRRCTPTDVAAVLHAAVRHQATRRTPLPSQREAAHHEWLLGTAARLTECADLTAASALLCETARQLTGASRTYCLFYDGSGGLLWTEGPDAREHSAIDGLAGFSARTGQSTCVPQAESDPRYQRSIDDPPGNGEHSLMTVPLVTPDGVVHAVLVVVGARDRPALGSTEFDALARFGRRAAPMLEHLGAKLEARDAVAVQRDGVFNEDAIAQFSQRHEHGDVVRVTPAWVGSLLWVLLALVVATVAYLCLGTIDEYSAGPAVVRYDGRVEVTVTRPGVLETVLVNPGDRVKAGTVVARLEARTATAKLDRLLSERQAQLRNRMANPESTTATQALITLRSRIEAARTQLAELEVRAPGPGIVSDVRIRNGQSVVSGDVVLSIVSQDASATLVAFLPGGDRPRLSKGMPLRLELSGYPYAYQNVTVTEVSDEVTGPAAAQRWLGSGVGDSVPMSGPVVMLRAELPATTFVADRKQFDLHDGMPGTAEVRLRRAPIIVVLVPALERLRGYFDD